MTSRTSFRRVVLMGAASLATALAAVPLAARAADPDDAWPRRPIRLVVPFPPGGGTDLVGRLLAERLATSLKQNVIVDNRPGATGIIGTEAVAKAAPDGYTLGIGISATHAINASLFAKLPYDPLRDFEPVAQITAGGTLLLASNASGLRSVADLVAAAKAKPGGVSYASWGNGSGGHLSGESLKMLAGIDMVHVPYKGVAALTNDLLAGHVPVAYGDVQSSLPHVRAGRIRALALSGPERAPCLPEVPTLKEQGVAFDTASWYGVFAPAKTPRAIIERLNAEVNAILHAPDVRERLAQLCIEPARTSPGQFAAIVARDIEVWRKIVNASGAKAE